MLRKGGLDIASHILKGFKRPLSVIPVVLSGYPTNILQNQHHDQQSDRALD